MIPEDRCSVFYMFWDEYNTSRKRGLLDIVHFYCYENIYKFLQEYQIGGTIVTYKKRQNFEDHVKCAQPTLL